MSGVLQKYNTNTVRTYSQRSTTENRNSYAR